MEYSLCINCIKDPLIILYTQQNFKRIISCSICNNSGQGLKIIDNEVLVSNLFKSILRFHYPEVKYNPNFSNNGLLFFFEKENKIINHNFYDASIFEKLIDCLYGDYGGDPVIIYSDKLDRHNYLGGFYYNLQDDVSTIWTNLVQRLDKENYYNVKPELEIYLKRIIKRIQSIIKIGSKFYRARIGYLEVEDLDFLFSSRPVAYSKKDICAPPPPKAISGRINREGISYLYLSSNENTAVSEVRPHPDHYVTIAQFKNDSEINFVDFRKINLLNFFSSQSDIELYTFANYLSKTFSWPVLPDQKHHYLLTQLVADTLRELGIKGIIYNSPMCEGYNIISFYPELFDFIEGSNKLLKIEKISCQYREVKFEEDDFGYYREQQK